jgi:hypothetical protein
MNENASKPRDVMPAVFLGLVGGLCAYEVYALAKHKHGDTISEIMWSVSSHYAILPFAFGVLSGHFFWQRNGSAASSTPAQSL